MSIKTKWVRQIVALPFFLTVLFTGCQEQVMPVYGHECFMLERGQTLIPINDQVKVEYLGLMKFIHPDLSNLALNKLYSADNMNTIISVDLDNNTSQLLGLLDGVDYRQKRDAKLGSHYLFQRDSLHIYSFAEKQENATVLYWNYSKDSARIADQFFDKNYYPNKFCSE